MENDQRPLTNGQVRFKKVRVGLLAIFSCFAGLIGFVAFGMTYLYIRNTSPTPTFAAPQNRPLFEGYALDGQLDFMGLSLYCFVVGVITVPHVGRLAPLLAGLLMTIGGTVIAFNVGPASQELYRLWLGALGGLVASGLMLPCLYLHKYWILGHSYRGQFSLKGLLLVFLAISLLLGALNMRREYYQQRAHARGNNLERIMYQPPGLSPRKCLCCLCGANYQHRNTCVSARIRLAFPVLMVFAPFFLILCQGKQSLATETFDLNCTHDSMQPIVLVW